jgi:hypothetical protein
MTPGFTAETALSRSHTHYSAGISACTGGNSVTPAFWKEIGHFFTRIAAPACRASCWGLGAAAATLCTVETVGTLVPQCLAGAAAATSICSDAC